MTSFWWVPGAPDEGFPADAVPGRFYMFESQPSVLYVLNDNGVWHALRGVLIPDGEEDAA